VVKNQTNGRTDGRTNERTNGDIEALADARRALKKGTEGMKPIFLKPWPEVQVLRSNL
jgi:hypothetical protein